MKFLATYAKLVEFVAIIISNYPLLFFSYPIMPTNTRKLQMLTSQLSPPLLALSVNRVYQATPHMLPPPWPPPWLSGLLSQFIKCHQRRRRLSHPVLLQSCSVDRLNFLSKTTVTAETAQYLLLLAARLVQNLGEDIREGNRTF